jgi:hypothetical protein
MTRVLLAAVCLLFVNCLFFSVNPIYDNVNHTFRTELLGTWRSSSQDWHLHITQRDPASYWVTEQGKKGRLELHLTVIGGKLFADLGPDDVAGRRDGLYAFHHLPVHSIFLIELRNDTVQVSEPNPDKLRASCRKGADSLACFEVKDFCIPTASTERVRHYLASLVGQSDGFQHLDRLVRD